MHITRENINTFFGRLQSGWLELLNRKKALKNKRTSRRAIEAFPGERELMRKPTALVTDTRLAFIDPYDRKLKTYMFEHMISVNKDYYKPTNFIRRFCKGLIFFGLMLLLITLIVDLLDNDSRGFLLVYIPALLSLIVGLLVWRDMRPKYKVEWKMRDGSTDKIATELLFSAWLVDSKKREAGMDELTRAMNEALSRKAWWPANNGLHARGDQPFLVTSYEHATAGNDAQSSKESREEKTAKRHLRLVTDNYQ